MVLCKITLHFLDWYMKTYNLTHCLFLVAQTEHPKIEQIVSRYETSDQCEVNECSAQLSWNNV